MPEQARAAARWGAPVALMAVIFVFSAMPSDDPERTLAELVLRKLAHFGEYAALALLWWRALRTRVDAGLAARIAFAICALYAISDEFHQSFVAGRVASPIDVAIDWAGAAAALTLALRRARVRA